MRVNELLLVYTVCPDGPLSSSFRLQNLVQPCRCWSGDCIHYMTPPEVFF